MLLIRVPHGRSFEYTKVGKDRSLKEIINTFNLYTIIITNYEYEHYIYTRRQASQRMMSYLIHVYHSVVEYVCFNNDLDQNET